MAEPAAKRATREDLDAVPGHLAAELIQGVLYTMTRPRPRHQRAGLVIGGAVQGPFDLGHGGPGGWWILSEPGIAFPALDVEEVSPDLAGWRKERLPELPDETINVVPDWVCEVLSPSTRSHDQRIKRPLYAQAGVRWMWRVDPEFRTATASRNEGGKWLELGVFVDDDVLRAEPFEVHAIELRDLWLTR